MLGTLIRKEIAETVLDLRFAVATLLCVVLIPLGMYVNCKDYERRLASHQREHQMYRQRYGTPKTPANGEEEVQGFRSPSVMSLFASGLDPFLPDKVFTSPQGIFRTVRNPRVDNPQSLLFGRMDFLFNVSFILSLAALIVSFNAVSGEKEMGTLSLMIANSVPRARIILAKVIGKYIALVIPFLASVLTALLILDASPAVSVGSPEVWPAFLAILGVTLLFILGMVCLGICISTFTRHSVASMILLFFVWVVVVLGIPKVSPMIAEVLYPVESEKAFSFARRMAVADIEKEFKQRFRETVETPWRQEEQKIWKEIETGDLMKRYKKASLAPGGESSHEAQAALKKLNKQINERLGQVHNKYEPQIDPLFDVGERRIAERIRQMEQDYRNRRNLQDSIALNLSRFSPVSCYGFVVAGLSDTGVAEPENFLQNAQRFQDQVKEVYYSKAYWRFGRHKYADGYSPWEPPVLPDMNYSRLTLMQTLQAGGSDILLLGLFDALFFALAFMRFTRYDVR